MDEYDPNAWERLRFLNVHVNIVAFKMASSYDSLMSQFNMLSKSGVLDLTKPYVWWVEDLYTLGIVQYVIRHSHIHYFFFFF